LFARSLAIIGRPLGRLSSTLTGRERGARRPAPSFVCPTFWCAALAASFQERAAGLRRRIEDVVQTLFTSGWKQELYFRHSLFFQQSCLSY